MRICRPVLPSLLLLALAAGRAEVRVGGRIANETGSPVAGARITISAASFTCRAVSDPTGAFRCQVPAPGGYRVEVDRDGFFRFVSPDFAIGGGPADIQVTLNTVHEVLQSVDVNATPGLVDMDRTTAQSTVSGAKLLDVPYPSTNNLRNALRIQPGMVQDNRGGIHLHGGAEEQTIYTLEGFQINDPLTGKLEARMSIESVQAIDVVAGRPSAEYGKGPAGVMNIRTRTGGDKVRYSATNFVPGLEYQKGVTIGGWTPRANLSGPWKRGRAWFSNSVDAQYHNVIIPELAKGEDRSGSWRFSNLVHNQANLAPSNILYSGLLVNRWNAPRTGLSALDPRETTLDRRLRHWFVYLKDQAYFSRGAVVEAGFAATRTFSREIPQGSGVYIITPNGKLGNSHADAARRGGREQFTANVFMPSYTLWGGHQIKMGADFHRLTYWQDVRRSGIEYADLEMRPLRRTSFFGSGQFSRGNVEASSYLQDAWRARPGLLLELGLRTDWDRLLRNWNVSPRAGFAWSPPGLDSTRVSGGVGRVFDMTSLRVFTRPQDQYAASTYFGPDGGVLRGPFLSVFVIGPERLRSPRYLNWNLGVEQNLPWQLQWRAGLAARSGSRGFTFVNRLDDGVSLPVPNEGPFVSPAYEAVYGLGSLRRDSYRSVELALRQPFRQQYEWMISYVRSRARSNAVVDQSVDEPAVVTDNTGPLPWDAPNRLLSWGFLPTPWKDWAASYLVEWRSGFPFSVVDPYGVVAGPVHQYRFPNFLELNLHAERRLTLLNSRWALRFGVNNITKHRNPNVVNNMMGAPHFLSFFGGQGRATVFRLRWLGRP